MSDYKFEIYEETDGDAHISRRLEEKHHGDVPETITDDQLKNGHAGETESTLEVLLENKRTGSAEVILEKNLNDAKDQFGSKHRNPSAYEGDISKLEEKRLAEYSIEGEKYESASETPKKERWWEVKSKDGLKIASVKKAQSDDFHRNLDFDNLDLDRELDVERIEDFDDDFDIDSMDEEGDVPFGDDFDIDDVDASSDLLKEISFKEIDVGGTPTIVGALEMTEGQGMIDDPRDIETELRSYMEDKGLSFSMDSFDFSQIDKGIVTFNVAAPEAPDEGPTDEGSTFDIDVMNEAFGIEASTSFPIVEAIKKK